MRAVIQRVTNSSVSIDGKIHASIGHGLLILLGIGQDDDKQDADWLVSKIASMRIFNDIQGKINLSISDIDGECMVISQFTLYASTKKGNRPSFIQSAPPDMAKQLYGYFVHQIEKRLPNKIKCGIFGADMKISLINDGPITIIMDSKNKE